MKTKKYLAPLFATCLLVGCNQKSTTVTIQFHSQYGGDIGKQTVNIGDYIVEPNLVEDSNQYVIGWYRDDKFTQRFDFSDPVTEDLNLYARWGGAIEFDYTYHSGGTKDTIKFGILTNIISLTTTNTMTITWGDDSEPKVFDEQTIMKGEVIVVEHTYKKEGTYRVSIDYPLMAFTFADGDEKLLADGNAYVNDFTINCPHPYTSIDSDEYFGSMKLVLGGKTSSDSTSDLSRVSASRNLKYFIDNEVFKNTKIESFYFSDGMYYIPPQLFSEQKTLKKIGFAKNSSLYDISASAFYNTDITSVSIPASVHIIEENAFYTNTLKSVKLNSILPPIGIEPNAFNADAAREIIIPKGSLKIYKEMIKGSEFAEKIIPLLKEAE
ncbi:MAG: leucine-rich repeat domain-containing protein [Bacilli bacterium]|nr:leucine-rich repeat domain-containing protein [Bacilli bacterium]